MTLRSVKLLLLSTLTSGALARARSAGPIAKDALFDDRTLAMMRDAKWLLMFSSATFCLPAALALSRSPRLWWLAGSYATTSAVSINYWRDPVPGARRNADMCMARASFAITCVAGLNVRDSSWHVVGWPLAALIPFFYWLSVALSGRKSRLWALAHMSMHACVSAGMGIVVAGSTSPL